MKWSRTIVASNTTKEKGILSIITSWNFGLKNKVIYTQNGILGAKGILGVKSKVISWIFLTKFFNAICILKIFWLIGFFSLYLLIVFISYY